MAAFGDGSRSSGPVPLHPSSHAPVVIERTEDVWLICDNGDRILDAGGGAIVTNIGHGRPEIAAVAAEALGQIDYVVPLWATENRVALVEELTEHWLPEGFTQASFFCGGSESVDAAVRLARTHHLAEGRSERWKVTGCRGSPSPSMSNPSAPRWVGSHPAANCSISAISIAPRSCRSDQSDRQVRRAPQHPARCRNLSGHFGAGSVTS